MARILVSLIAALLIVATIYVLTNRYSYNAEEEKEKISQVIDSSIGWFKDKDFDLLFSLFAHDPNYLLVPPDDQILCGFDHFKKDAEIFNNPEFLYVRHEIKDLKINISRSKNVAWFYCKLDDINTWKGQPASWENVRWTGILEKRNGKWVIVQQHFSYPINNSKA